MQTAHQPAVVNRPLVSEFGAQLKMKLLLSGLLAILLVLFDTSSACSVVSQTTVSGSAAPTGPICPGQLIFEDNFNELDYKKWHHESTLGGGGNWEFQWYTNNRSNSYAENGILYLTPTLTADAIGEAGLSSASISLHGGTSVDGYVHKCSEILSIKVCLLICFHINFVYFQFLFPPFEDVRTPPFGAASGQAPRPTSSTPFDRPASGPTSPFRSNTAARRSMRVFRPATGCGPPSGSCPVTMRTGRGPPRARSI